MTPGLCGRWQTVLGDELGHQRACAVEAGKIAAKSEAINARIDTDFIDRGLTAGIDAFSLATSLQKYRNDLHDAAAETLHRAAIAPVDVGAVILVGGSSLMSMVEDIGRALCPTASIERSDAFTAVVDGLAMATR